MYRIPESESERAALEEALDETRGSHQLAGRDDSLAAAARALLHEVDPVIATPTPPSWERHDQLECATFREIYARACSIALGVPVHRRNPLVAALMTRRIVLIAALFAGHKREGDVEDWAWRHGGVAACFDIQRDSLHGNLRDGRVTGAILAAADAGWIIKVLMAMPCESFTCMKLVPVPPGEPEAPPLRLRSCLPGVPECPAGWEPYFNKHERFVLWGWAVAAAVLKWEGGGLFAEHPVDRGDEQKPRFYREHFAEHAPLSLHPKTIEMQERFGIEEIDVLQCMSGCEHEKGTTIFADRHTAKAVRAAALPCVHLKHEECAGTDADGNSISQMASYWSSEFNRWAVLATIGASPATVRKAALDAAAPELLKAGLSRSALEQWVYFPVGRIPYSTSLAELGLCEPCEEGIT